MDHIDDKILTILKRNGKASATEISKVVGLSIPAVAERIRKMEHAGIIEGYGAKSAAVRRDTTSRLLLWLIWNGLATSKNSGKRSFNFPRSWSVITLWGPLITY